MSEGSTVRPLDRISRRGFMKRVGGAALAASGFVPQGSRAEENQGVVSSSVRSITTEVEGKTEAIEKIGLKLGVELISISNLKEHIGLENYERYLQRLHVVVPYDWDLARAELLMELADSLPREFLEQDSRGNKLHLFLANFEDERVSGDFMTDYREAPPVLRLDYENFSPVDKQTSLELLTHELVHYLQRYRGTGFDEMLEDTFHITPEDFCLRLLNNLAVNNSFTGEGELTEAMLSYGVVKQDEAGNLNSRSDSFEVEATLGQIYLYGRDNFLRRLNPYFSVDQVTSLYNHLKESVFQDREYGPEMMENFAPVR